jgi:hypothetical protein
MNRRMESPLLRWKRQAHEAKIAKNKHARERHDQSVADVWTNSWERARKHTAMIAKLDARHAVPRNVTQTDRRARRVALEALKERASQPKKPWR